MPERPLRPSWRHRLKLNLWQLVVIVLLLGGVLGYIVRSAHVQRDAVAAINRGGGKVRYDFQVVTTPAGGAQFNPNAKPGWPKWLLDSLGPDFFGHVTWVVVGPEDPDAVMVHVGNLKRLEQFTSGERSPLTNTGLAHLRGLTRLKGINLPGTRVTGEGLVNLKEMNKLTHLVLPDAALLADGDLANLSGMTALETLHLDSPGVTDAGLVPKQALYINGVPRQSIQANACITDGVSTHRRS